MRPCFPRRAGARFVEPLPLSPGVTGARQKLDGVYSRAQTAGFERISAIS